MSKVARPLIAPLRYPGGRWNLQFAIRNPQSAMGGWSCDPQPVPGNDNGNGLGLELGSQSPNFPHRAGGWPGPHFPHRAGGGFHSPIAS